LYQVVDTDETAIAPEKFRLPSQSLALGESHDSSFHNRFWGEFLSQSTFRFPDCQTLITWLESVGPGRRKLIQRVILQQNRSGYTTLLETSHEAFRLLGEATQMLQFVVHWDIEHLTSLQFNDSSRNEWLRGLESYRNVQEFELVTTVGSARTGAPPGLQDRLERIVKAERPVGGPQTTFQPDLALNHVPREAKFFAKFMPGRLRHALDAMGVDQQLYQGENKRELAQRVAAQERIVFDQPSSRSLRPFNELTPANFAATLRQALERPTRPPPMLSNVIGGQTSAPTTNQTNETETTQQESLETLDTAETATDTGPLGKRPAQTVAEQDTAKKHKRGEEDGKD
jgi:hypothetical protein